MTTLKQGDLIKHKSGNTSKIMGVCGDVVHIANYSNPDKYGYATDEASLKEYGYTWDTPAWEPSIDQRYWCFGSCGEAIRSSWADDSTDHRRKDFLGIYETKELCEAALLEIRRKLEK